VRTTVWTRYAEARQLNATLRGVAMMPLAADWSVGLLALKGGVDATQVPGRDDVVEISSVAHPSYARRPLGSTTLLEPAAPAIPSVSNDAQVLFAEAATAWGTVAALGLFDNAGNLWAVIPSAVADRRTIRIGDRIAIPAGEIVITGYDG
jgi:hypothetical protein